MYQNKAAAHERLEKLEEAMADCDQSLKCNNRYGKALDRRAKVMRKLTNKLGGGDENNKLRVAQLMQALEDLSMCCQLDGFRQDQLAFVDELREESQPGASVCPRHQPIFYLLHTGSIHRP